jgi:hypothetical protein
MDDTNKSTINDIGEYRSFLLSLADDLNNICEEFSRLKNLVQGKEDLEKRNRTIFVTKG